MMHMLLGFVDPDLIVVSKSEIGFIGGPGISFSAEGFPSFAQAFTKFLCIQFSLVDAWSATKDPLI